MGVLTWHTYHKLVSWFHNLKQLKKGEIKVMERATRTTLVIILMLGVIVYTLGIVIWLMK